MSILVKTVRINGFRGINNFEIDLDSTTVITGMNNTGKTTLLKALQISFGDRRFINKEDFNITGKYIAKNIVIDIKIIPIDDEDHIKSDFDEEWETTFTESRIKIDIEGNSFIPFRTIMEFDEINSYYRAKQFILQEWPLLKNEKNEMWYEVDNGKEMKFNIDEFQFFYIDAKRDILDDIKVKKSFLGKMMSQVEYNDEDSEKFEKLIEEINSGLTTSSDILSEIKSNLESLNSTVNTSKKGNIEITPISKKIHDLYKGMSIYYSDSEESFPMEYHGMGTRSWSSLLSFKAFNNLSKKASNSLGKPYFSLIALEEPESHLHPNAQKQLFKQINGIIGQKLISTHSPFISAPADLSQIRSIYKEDNQVRVGRIKVEKLNEEDLRKIKRQIIQSKGEILFSKIIIFCEGETEEQALPILFKHHFNIESMEVGINFVGVGSYNYLPFLHCFEGLSIPYFIFSDAEELVKNDVKEKFSRSGSSRKEEDVIIFLDDGNNFEKQMISEGFQEEMKKAIIKSTDFVSPQHESGKIKEIMEYDDETILQVITNPKTKYSPIIAEEISKSGKKLPKHVLELFKRLKVYIYLEVSDAS